MQLSVPGSERDPGPVAVACIDNLEKVGVSDAADETQGSFQSYNLRHSARWLELTFV